jgi:hypothetical protein
MAILLYRGGEGTATMMMMMMAGVESRVDLGYHP